MKTTKWIVASMLLMMSCILGCGLRVIDKKIDDAWTIDAKKQIEEINSGKRDSLQLMYTKETDSLLALIDPSSQFNHAYFLQTDVSKSGFAEIGSNRGLRSINLVCTTKPDGILEAIAEIESLRQLSFESIPLTPSGIEALQNCPSLGEPKFSLDELNQLQFDVVSALKKTASLRKLVINEVEVVLGNPKNDTASDNDSPPER